MKVDWRIVVAVGLGLAVIAVAGVAIVGRTHGGAGSSAAANAVRPAPSPGTKSPRSTPSPALTATTPTPQGGSSPTPSPTPEIVPTGAGAGPPGGGTVPPAPPVNPPAYTFAPQASPAGAAPSASLVTADLSGGDRLVVAAFSVTAPGTVSLHGFGAVSGLAACLEFGGQGCTPVGIPNPAFWNITADDLAHHADYDLRVSVSLTGGGLDFGWNGPHQATVSNLPVPGGCTAATGYKTGCGVRFRITSGGALAVAAPGDFHLKVRDKATGTVACDKHMGASMSCPLPYGTVWTGYLYPETSAPGSTTLTVSWP